MEYFQEAKFLQWVDELAEKDYVVIDDFFDPGIYQKIVDFFLLKQAENEFSKAALGDAFSRQIVSEIRGDFSYWLDKKKDEQIRQLFELIEEMISLLNRYCFLSLSGYEFHFTHYPKASFYKKHLDQFKGRSNRLVSVIIYMNKDWRSGDGGELRMFDKGKQEIIVNPIANRCVLFKSDKIVHEVLRTNVGRNSLTGWLLYLPTDVAYLLS